MSNRGRHHFYLGFDIHVRYLNPEQVPGWNVELGYRFEIWSPKVIGHRRKKVHTLSEAYLNPAVAIVVTQAKVDKIVSTLSSTCLTVV